MKSLYILIAAFSFFLMSCSSSYRSVQTTDDVYYSPAVTNSGNQVVRNSQVISGNDEDGGDYVMMDDGDSYGYRNDVQEEWEIRRGIRNPLYRNSFSISLGFGAYPYYNPFYTPLFSPFGYYGYNNFWNPYSFNNGWMSHGSFGYYNPYGYGYYPTYGSYYSYYPYYNNYYGGHYGGSHSGIRVRDNGPRIMNVGTPRTGNGIIPGNNGDRRPVLAPVRVMRGNNGNNNGTIERRAPRSSNGNVSPDNNSRNVRKFNRRNNDDYRTQPTDNRRYTPPTRTRDVSPSPTRTFERPSPSIDRTPSAPPSNNSGTKSAPVRKF